MSTALANAGTARIERQIYGLDLIRFCAALLVVGHHLGFMIWVRNIADMHYRYLGPYTWAGWTGVEIFFVLSGFVIAYSADRASASSFARSRFVRLYPAAWICSSITAAALVMTHQMSLGWSLLQRWGNALILFSNGPWVDGGYWTLSIEIGFYLVVFLLLFARWFHHLGLVMSLIGCASSLGWIYVFLWRHGRVHPGPWGQAYFQWLTGNAWAARLLVQHGCFFAIGCLLWLCFFQRITFTRVLVIVLCCAGGVCEILWHAIFFYEFAKIDYSKLTPVLLWLSSVVAICASVKYNEAIRQALGQRGARVARTLGVITYPLYLLNQVAGSALLAQLHGKMPDLMALLLSVLLLIAASFLISRYLETPIQHGLRHVLGFAKRGVRPVAATVP